ncbi:adenylate kinase [uncultured Desulfuromonas sp.]|uniref:adenylate kinase n=1 Tax=uncultured Desulfuromonas sp. TaxID=181013 RepID=UPI002AABD6C2|nr:adenylate kinase [uncultured Desulfuromonas sp.]
MKRVAVFGNAGGGKSTLAKRLAETTGLPLHPLDTIKFRPGGDEIPQEEYLALHAELLKQPEWIIDGFGCMTTLWQRLAEADTLVYLDLPLPMHAWWVTKRLIKGLWVTPEGWPEGSPMWRSTLSSYRVLWLCHRHLTPRYRAFVAQAVQKKQVFHLRTPGEIEGFLRETANGAQANS